MQRASLTAQGIAVLRALESQRPARERLFYDPYAFLFANPILSSLTGFLARTGYTEWRGPGVQGFLLARTRYIDEYLISSLVGGIRQLVILGAGYDARAYRFAEALVGRVRVFEVDHPATQRVKVRKLERAMGKLPPHVAFVPANLESDSLSDRLSGAGYCEGRKTLFIWEGVTMYLEAPAVDATLAVIAGRSGPGSTVILDYVHQAVIDGQVKRAEAAGMRRYQRFTGEGLHFGIEGAQAARFLEGRGFCAVVDVTASQLEKRYFGQGPRQGTRVAPVYGIASAAVAPHLLYLPRQ